MVYINTINNDGTEVKSATMDKTPQECLSRLQKNVQRALKAGLEPDCTFEVYSDECKTLFGRVSETGEVRAFL